MFSGIVETLGTITHLQKMNELLNVTIQPHINFDDVSVGDSISVNGTCLTVTKNTETFFVATIVPETLKLTNLGFLTTHEFVNLERSLKVSARNGGHNVQGHVDSTGEIVSIDYEGKESLLVQIKVLPYLTKYIVKKGFITLDGMSLTIIDVGTDWFTVTLIPHTQKITVAKNYKLGTLVNLEVDILGKYIEKFVEAQKK